MAESFNNRILIVDDNASIHEDFIKILPVPGTGGGDLRDLIEDVLGENESAAKAPQVVYQLDHAMQGREGYEKAVLADKSGQPYALIFMDVRMPPGWDGIETTRHIWQDCPYSEVVICTAYSDYSWEQILEQLGSTDQLQFLRKPFDIVSIKQMALALTTKWNLARKARQYVQDLENEVAVRTKELVAKIDEISKLRGILPMCAYCHKIRVNDKDYWQQVDEYIRSHTLAEISHGICPECYEKLMVEIKQMGTPENVSGS